MTQVVQFKRGTKQTLIDRLVAGDLGVLKAGEPAYETDTGQLKVGDGTSNYEDLPYVGTDSGGLDPRFEITDPSSNQILVYDSTKQKWVNKTTIFTHSSDELIGGKVYHVLWKVKPTSSNTVDGTATDPETGELYDICSENGTITASKVVVQKNTISTSEIEDLFK